MAVKKDNPAGLTPFQMEVVRSVVPEKGLKKSAKKDLRFTEMQILPAEVSRNENGEEEREPPSLRKSILNILDGGGKNTIERLAFSEDPSNQSTYQGLIKQKVRLLPDSLIKRIIIQDDLVASIVNTRANQVAAFGRKRPDRHSIGFVIEPKDDSLYDSIKDEQKKELHRRIKRAEELFLTCGRVDRVRWDDRLSLSQFFYACTKNAVANGRISVEAIFAEEKGQRVFHRFRPIDAGTIYRTVPHSTAAEQVRKDARSLLEQLHNERLEPEKYLNDEYAWVQVHEGRPLQAFTHEECLVHNFYPTNDIEMDGYPVTPLDTVISAVTCHINITNHNKIYFQSGRASRGMLVIRSDDVDETVVARVRQQFNASINGVAAAWRMPVFGVGAEDEITWQPIDSGGRDMEFQYLSDTNARVILSAFQMSPEELPGYSHLSRGTNSQALSESNQEYLLEAHRDVGIRPLLRHWEDFLNTQIFPLIDKNLSEICEIKLSGLDAETAEKESIRLQQDGPVHMTYDETLAVVEKDPVGKEWGGDYPFNPSFQAILDKFITVGQQMEHFFGIQGASKRPEFNYLRDPFYFQNMQMQMQMQQMQMQQQMAQQQQQGGSPPGDGGGAPGGGGGGGDAPPQQGGDAQEQSAGANAQSSDSDQQAQQSIDAQQELGQNVDAAQQALGKSEKLDSNQKRLIAKQNKVIAGFNKAWEKAAKRAASKLAKELSPHLEG